MKKRILASIIFLILVSGQLITQSNRTDDDIMLNPFWDFYSFNYLNSPSAGRGFTGIAAMDNDVSGILLNPASMNISTKAQLNFQYTFKTSQDWLPGLNLGIKLKQQLFSSSAGFGYRLNKQMQTGIIYSNPSGYYFDLGKIIRTDEFGNEIGQYDMYYSVRQHDLTIPFVYSGKNFSTGIGVDLIYSLFTAPPEGFTTLEDPTGGEDLKGSSYFATLRGGFIYSITPDFNFGLTFTTGGKSKVKYRYPVGVADQSASHTFPWKAGVGLQYEPVGSKLRLNLDYDYSRTSVVSTLKDRHDFHIGAEGEIDKNWILRGGFFTLLDYRNTTDNNFVDPAHEYDQYFITFGGSYIKKNYRINLALLTSQISPGKIKNLYINFGMTFDL
ncbi:MAG: hypothetical protein IT281_02970 [Ignavibacteria bacterium]|nr:hypothetical protein [Ignavibacteria bacterium]